MPMSLLHDIECLCAWNFTCCFLPDICKIPDSPHLIPLLSLYLYSAYCWTSLRSATFCSSSLVFCHSWVPRIPSAKLNMLSPKTLWTNWPDFISFPCLCVCHSSGPASSAHVDFIFAESTFPALARESNPYCFPWPPDSETYLAKWHWTWYSTSFFYLSPDPYLPISDLDMLTHSNSWGLSLAVILALFTLI